MRLTASEIAAITGGAVVAGDPDAGADGFTIDSRTVTPGEGFVALVAERDGNDFTGDALARGASVALVSRELGVDVPAGAALVRVDDGLAALTRLGRAARARLQSATVVGITGSAGKTATKDLTAAALARRHRVHATYLSFNNEAGVPLTVLGAHHETEVLVAEMGARFPGNIRDLCEIVAPTVGVITNVGLAHSGLLGGREGVAAVKGELVDALPDEGFAVLPADDDVFGTLAVRTSARVLRVGPEGTAGADVTTSAVVLDEELRPDFTLESEWGRLRIRVPLRGAHQVSNAAMAATVALALGIGPDEVVEGLAAAAAAPWRMELSRTVGGAQLLNDAYNASPTSTAAALHAFAELPVRGRRIAVLGEMLELGEESEREHRRIGALAAMLGLDLLVLVGDSAAAIGHGARDTRPEISVLEVMDVDDAIAAVVGLLRDDDAILVKASRAAGLERVAHALTTVGAGT